jgi:hypothetical protein
MPNPHIDYSQYKNWHQCPAYWYEVAVNKRVKKWPERQRTDPLAIGTLAHAGLQVWQERRVIEIPGEVVEKTGPTKETLELALRLVYGYSQAYPQELWELVKCEEPVRWPLLQAEYQYACPWCGNVSERKSMPRRDLICPECKKRWTESMMGSAIDGLAKIDHYFYVPTQTTIESGVPGYQLSLSRGWWIQEYKTKSDSKTIEGVMQRWETNMQASFQMLALQNKLTPRDDPESHFDAMYQHNQVQGVLVTQLEYHPIYVPKRKCKSCEQSYEMFLWGSGVNGASACPGCNCQQKLKPYASETFKDPFYFRIIATRSPERLARDEAEIRKVALEMERYRNTGIWNGPSPNREACMSMWNRECAYYRNHTFGFTTIDDPNYEEPEDYLGEKKDS